MNRRTRPTSFPSHASPEELTPGVLERRKWVRFVIPDLVTRVSWMHDERSESHLVSLVNVSGEGVAVMMDVPPPHGRSFTIQFDHGNSAGVTISSQLVKATPTEDGRTLATFRFELPDGATDRLPQQRERRSWRRQVPREKTAVLSWVDGNSAVSIGAEIQDIGGGGVRLKTLDRPPADQMLWLWVGREGYEAGPVNCRLVGCTTDDGGAHTVRLSFIDLCPMPVFVAAMGLHG